MQCIRCKQSGKPSIAHIIPEPLSCPDGFVLRDGAVCRSCNNKPGHLDQAVIDDFDLASFMYAIPRKCGRPAELRNRGNLLVTIGPNGAEISINSVAHPVTARDGSTLASSGNSKRNIVTIFERRDESGTISFSVEIGRNSKFVRGVTKALSEELQSMRV